MNQTFNFQRFLLLMKVEWAEKGRIQVLTAGLLLAFLLMLMLPVVFFDEYKPFVTDLQTTALIMVVVFGGSLYTNLAFSQYGPRDKGMAALMVPASHLEKFLTPLVLSLIVIVPLMVLFLWLHNWTIDYSNARLPATDPQYRKMPLAVLQSFVVFYILIQGVFFLGSLYFTRSSYVKVATALVVITLVFAAANKGIVWFLLADAGVTSFSAAPFTSWDTYFDGTTNHTYRVSYMETIQNLMHLIPILITICLWYITYVRLKEKEI